MLKKVVLILAVAFITGLSALAQTSGNSRKWEFTARYNAGFITSGPDFTAGMRINNNTTVGLLAGYGDSWFDADAVDAYSISTAIYARRYFHLNKRDVFAFYSDFALGARWLTKVDGNTTKRSAGDVWFLVALEPGVRVRFYRNLHLFFGPTIAPPYCMGFHLGIGF